MLHQGFLAFLFSMLYIDFLLQKVLWFDYETSPPQQGSCVPDLCPQLVAVF